MWYLNRITVLSLVLACLLLAGCKSETLRSVWLNPTSIVSGNPDWWNLPAYRIEKLNGSLTMVNDSGAFYIRFYSPERNLAGRFKGAGLTLWFSRPEKPDLKWGIRYPMGMHGEKPPAQSGHFLPKADLPPSSVVEMLKMQNDDLEIISPDSTVSGRKTAGEADQMGLQAQYMETPNSVELTFRIEIAELIPWLKPGATILLKAESPAMERKKLRKGEDGPPRGMPGFGGNGQGPGGGGGFPGGGMGGGPQGKGHSEGMEKRSGGIQQNKPIDLQFTVILDAGPKKTE